MRLFTFLPLLLLPGPTQAWDTIPHQDITRAALDTLPQALLDRFQPETACLIEIYCMLPDRYVEMERFGFVRKGQGPRDASEIRSYCVRPDGRPVHGATGDRNTDMASLVYLFERIATSLPNRPGASARYAGVLSHFIADSLSPPHAVSPEQLRSLAPPPADTGKIDLHAAMERTVPKFTLGDRAPHALSAHILPAAQATLERCYAGAEQNRRDLPSMVKAVSVRDHQSLDVYQHRAARKAAELLADALYTLWRMGEASR